ncbi:serine--tRNA ligase [Putridiphycobacter roseus]|uniref:Serine--tRNA ligase n=1 Tax=Putridiphycobacter roseus TaxID=2219161 RepID=A0A2W1NQS7_9FLAO|nr:serine--tRNA ligase [Putridiphycobacter roseus]PZE17018.1 serine--tRNA ligase [Putridiphycobacter roseus]
MLEITKIRENKDEIIAALKVRNFDADKSIQEVLRLDNEWRSAKGELDGLAAEANKLTKEIGDLYKSGQADKANEVKAKSAALKANEPVLKDKVAALAEEINAILYLIPNVPNKIVPPGNADTDNVVEMEHGTKPSLPKNALPHWELAKKYDIIDFELGVKVTGAGFPFYLGKGARLQRALINFFLDHARDAGYKEVIPPLLVNEESGRGTGQLPDKEGQMYHTPTDDFYLIPTSEVPLTNIYRDVIVKESDFPIKLTAYTPCFRREAGSYGSDVRGLNRLHQFDKVEIVRIEHPDRSYQALEEMVNHVEELLKALELPYRKLRLCGGDLGFTSALTYDLEVYSAAQDKWLEVSSVSNFETFQANRLKLRYKDADKKSVLAHTLNGSALALPRILAALLENNQTENGINIPKVLVPYTGFECI